jgi:hypothetical protein
MTVAQTPYGPLLVAGGVAAARACFVDMFSHPADADHGLPLSISAPTASIVALRRFHHALARCAHLGDGGHGLVLLNLSGSGVRWQKGGRRLSSCQPIQGQTHRNNRGRGGKRCQPSSASPPIAAACWRRREAVSRALARAGAGPGQLGCAGVAGELGAQTQEWPRGARLTRRSPRILLIALPTALHLLRKHYR